MVTDASPTNDNSPAWLDRAAYPFASHHLTLRDGRMHYVDEGAGEVLLFVHGNPSWSFEYRALIRHFSKTHRCIAPDHLGFGLSDKPKGVSYLPQYHAENFARFLDALDLDQITLVVNDWGGPIALDWAVAHASRIRRIIALNSWFFDVRDQQVLRTFSNVIGSPVGRFLCRQFNLFPRVLMKASFGDKLRLTPSAHSHYLAPFPDPASRTPTWVFPRAITGESDWLDRIWQRRAGIARLPTLLVWGMKDAAFAPLVHRWQEAFPNHRSVTFEDIGHSVAEEASERLIPIFEDFFRTEAAT
ncbi:MAG: alpha/beta fold hydrolase [Caulobacter sp.]|nr:alpha/beta fold hydrolase [Caulobacter sp.]